MKVHVAKWLRLHLRRMYEVKVGTELGMSTAEETYE